MLRGIAAPLMVQNVDTDVLSRTVRLLTIRQEDLARYAFEAWRYLPDGSENPDFLLNHAPYRNASILLNDANFGCGSSREGAVWALQAMGYRCLIAPSFGDIFFGNCFQNGVLPIVLPIETVNSIADEVRADPAAPLTVDLPQQHIVLPSGRTVVFEIEAYRRAMLLEGLDEIQATLRRMPEISKFRERDMQRRPWAQALVPQAAPSSSPTRKH